MTMGLAFPRALLPLAALAAALSVAFAEDLPPEVPPEKPAEGAEPPADGAAETRDAATPPPLPRQGYYVEIDGVSEGPYSLLDVERLFEDGEIETTTLIWRPGMTEWEQASAVSELSLLFDRRDSLKPKVVDINFLLGVWEGSRTDTDGTEWHWKVRYVGRWHLHRQPVPQGAGRCPPGGRRVDGDVQDAQDRRDHLHLHGDRDDQGADIADGVHPDVERHRPHRV